MDRSARLDRAEERKFLRLSNPRPLRGRGKGEGAGGGGRHTTPWGGKKKADADLVGEGLGAGLDGEVADLAEAFLEPRVGVPRDDHLDYASRPHPAGAADQDASRRLVPVLAP